MFIWPCITRRRPASALTRNMSPLIGGIKTILSFEVIVQVNGMPTTKTLDEIRNVAACVDCSPAGPLNDGISGIELAIHAAYRCDACLLLLLAAETEWCAKVVGEHCCIEGFTCNFDKIADELRESRKA